MPEITLHDAPDADGNAIRYTFNLPGGWDDALLTGQHLGHICKALAFAGAMQAKLVEEDDALADDPTPKALAKLDLFYDLLQLPHALRSRMSSDPEDYMYETDTTDYHTGYVPVETSEYQVLPQLDWCWQTPKYRRSLLPKLQHNDLEWIGPDDDFNTMVLDQWLWCVQLLRSFREAKPEDAESLLNHLVGALYVPTTDAEWSSDPIDVRAEQLATLPVQTKLAAVLNFEAIHANLADDYDRVFDPTGSVSQSPQGVFGMAYDVARSGVFGKEQEVRRVRLHDVMGYMEHSLYVDEENAKRAKEAARESRYANP